MKKKTVLDLLFLFFLGVLSSMSLPPFNFFFINFFTFSVFFIFIFKKTDNFSKKFIFFSYGWAFGFGYFLTNLYWITISLTFDQSFSFLIPIALVLIPAFLALFYGFVTIIYSFLNIKNLISAFFLFSLLFGLVEFIRGNILTGFPWNLIIFSFSEQLNFISFASIIGTYSFNLLVISLFSAPALIILRKSKKEILVSFFFILIPILLLVYGSSYKQKFLNTDIKKNSYVIRAIGSNISLDRFYDNTSAETVINELINLSAPEKNKKIFFLWPEGIVPNTYLDQLNLYKDLFVKNFDENHIIGLGIKHRLERGFNEEYFNSLAIFDNNINLINNYNKINLVPFGEFIPFENIFYKLNMRIITNNILSFSKGNSREIIEIKKDSDKFSFLPLICYEIIFSGNLTKNFNYDFILNISEDGWFGKSIGPRQHFTHSIFRAIENGKYIVRSANNGMAAIINPLGEIEKQINYEEAGFIDFYERRDIERTIFSIYGNKIFIILILLYIFLIFSFIRINNE